MLRKRRFSVPKTSSIKELIYFSGSLSKYFRTIFIYNLLAIKSVLINISFIFEASSIGYLTRNQLVLDL